VIINAKIIGENISYENYSRQGPDVKRGDPSFSMSRSELIEFALNPRRWKDGYGLKEENTKSTFWGSIIDCLLTSPEQFESRYSVAPATYARKVMKCPSCGSETDSKSCRKCSCPREETVTDKPWDSKATVCKEWEESQGDKIVIKSELKQSADLAVKAIGNNPTAAGVFAASMKQVMVIGFWKDELTKLEIPIRCLIDAVPYLDGPFCKWTIDFKTSRNGNPASWDRTVDDEGYDVQAALIMDLYVAATKEDRVDFVHIVQENMFPFHVVDPPPALSAEYLDWGRNKYRAALRKYCQCIATGNWPSYDVVGFQMRDCKTQIIGPEELYHYKKTCGIVGDHHFVPPPEPETKDENCDTTP
jgi:hypothetical protein